MAYALLMGSQADWIDVFFTPEGNDTARNRRERELHHQLEQHSRAAQQMCSSSSSSGGGATPDGDGYDSAEGCFRMEPCAGLWAAGMVMVWQRKHGCYLALACEDMDENIPLASATLQLLRIGLAERLGTTRRELGFGFGFGFGFELSAAFQAPALNACGMQWYRWVLPDSNTAHGTARGGASLGSHARAGYVRLLPLCRLRPASCGGLWSGDRA